MIYFVPKYRSHACPYHALIGTTVPVFPGEALTLSVCRLRSIIRIVQVLESTCTIWAYTSLSAPGSCRFLRVLRSALDPYQRSLLFRKSTRGFTPSAYQNSALLILIALTLTLDHPLLICNLFIYQFFYLRYVISEDDFTFVIKVLFEYL